MNKKYHWVDDEVKIDFKLPGLIQDLVNERKRIIQYIYKRTAPHGIISP